MYEAILQLDNFSVKAANLNLELMNRYENTSIGRIKVINSSKVNI